MIWDDFNNLTAGQKAKAAQFAAIGEALAAGTAPDLSSVTYSQAKAADLILRDMQTLVGPAIAGIKYVKKVSQAEAIAAFDAANP
jgi:hypothetical protein